MLPHQIYVSVVIFNVTCDLLHALSREVDYFVVVSNVISDSSIFTSLRCYFFGDISSKRDPKAYLKYIFALYDHYQREYCMLKDSKNPVKVELPLVVNTPGWVKGELTFSISLF